MSNRYRLRIPATLIKRETEAAMEVLEDVIDFCVATSSSSTDTPTPTITAGSRRPGPTPSTTLPEPPYDEAGRSPKGRPAFPSLPCLLSKSYLPLK